MVEKLIPFKNIESGEPTPRPNTLDIVKIEGRWAQANGNIIKFLDDKSEKLINWDDFKLTKDWGGLPVAHVKKLTSFNDEEIERIHWGPEQKQHPYLKGVVAVFGEFEKK